MAIKNMQASVRLRSLSHDRREIPSCRFSKNQIIICIGVVEMRDGASRYLVTFVLKNRLFWRIMWIVN